MGSTIRLLIVVVALAICAGSASAREGTASTELAMRAAPSSNTELLLTIPAGASVSVGACSGGWCKVTWNSYSGYAVQSGLVISAGAPRAAARGAVNAPDVERWPIFPPYPYRAGYYPKADWYYKMPPYVALKPSFYRKRYFMMAQERNRYRYMPHIFRGYSADDEIDYGGDADFNYKSPDMTNGDIKSPTTTNGDKPKP